MSTPATLVIADAAVGVILIAASLGRWRTPSGALLIAGGGSWLLADVAPALTFLHRGVLIQLVLTHPAGRLPWIAVRVTVVAGYAYACLLPVAGSDGASLVMAAVVVGVAVHRRGVATGPERQSLSAALAAAVCLAAALVVGPVSRTSGMATPSTTLAMYDLMVVCVALLIAQDMLRLGSPGRALTGLVVDLGELTGTDVLRQRLADGLGDPGLQIGYWLPAIGAYADDAGRAMVLPAPGDRRAITPLSVEGQPVAVLVHDRVVLADPGIRGPMAAAAQWAVGNVALGAQVRAQVDRVEASTQRIVTAAVAERERLEEKLQQGAGRRLRRVADLVGADGGGLTDLAADVDRARTDIGEFARGLHPRTLTELGLPAALRELAGSCPLPVDVQAESVRLPTATETTLYFACSEALTNVLKYARATAVQVRVTADAKQVSLVVTDDGVGGADVSSGSGLLGLADRVEALGGSFDVHSPEGAGTRIDVSLPNFPGQDRAATLAS